MRRIVTVCVLVSLGLSTAALAQVAALVARRTHGTHFLVAARMPERADRVCFVLLEPDPDSQEIVSELGCAETVYTSDDEGLVQIPEIGSARIDPHTSGVFAEVSVPPGAIHRIRARAQNAAGESPLSERYYLADMRAPDPAELLDYALELLDTLEQALLAWRAQL